MYFVKYVAHFEFVRSNSQGRLASVLHGCDVVVLLTVTGIPIWAGIVGTGLVCVFYTSIVSCTDSHEVHDSSLF